MPINIKRAVLFFAFILISIPVTFAHPADTTFITPFERSNGRQTATYAEVLDFYKRLKGTYTTISMGDVGPTDIGYPLRYIAYSKEGNFSKENSKEREGKMVLLINNGIHP